MFDFGARRFSLECARRMYPPRRGRPLADIELRREQWQQNGASERAISYARNAAAGMGSPFAQCTLHYTPHTTLLLELHAAVLTVQRTLLTELRTLLTVQRRLRQSITPVRAASRTYS